MQAEHYQRRLDEEIPALGGLTPRQATARKGALRSRLELLLAEIEHHEAGQPEAQRFDMSVLRSALGLEKTASPAVTYAREADGRTAWTLREG